MEDFDFKSLEKEELEQALDILMQERKKRYEEAKEIDFAIYEINKIMIQKGWK